MSTTARPDVPFRYRASTDAGVMRDGVVRAASREAALRELRRQALVPVELEPVAPPSGNGARWSLVGESRTRAVALWTRTLATMVDAGAPLERALDTAGAQVSHAAVRGAVERVRLAVRGGSALALAMRAHPETFGALHVGMVQAGEASGSLGAALLSLAGYLDEDDARRADRNAALVYPALMAVVSTLGILVLLLFVVPRFAGLLGELDGQLPWSTRVLVAMGTVVGRYWWALAGVLAVVGTVLARWGATVDGQLTLARWRLSAPVLGTIERGVATARLTRALGLLLRGGMPLLPALSLARSGVGNPGARGSVGAGHRSRGTGRCAGRRPHRHRHAAGRAAAVGG